ncbi:hypothetical protein B0T19DRAFT_285862 [Cercophora scortea]|uniref:MPN domain-containing protein n=1 Tax=Cercophora scortea TaxID=314031 RepID=A0AAE0I917_9PEZI|nr:hypothetical protein B0T19DRAFT_285862 [Cercophora scortea]
MGAPDFEDHGRPLSPGELSTMARQYEWNPNLDFKYWACAAEMLHHEGHICLREGNLAKAYMLLLRYSFLVLDNLHTHPNAKAPEARKAARPLEKRIPAVVELLETIRPQINESYQEWSKITGAQRDKPRNASASSSSAYARHAANDPALSWNHVSPAKFLDAAENQELAVDLAKSEMYRRRRQAGISEEEERKRRGAGLWDGWNDTSQTTTSSRTPFMEDDLQRQMEATRRQLDSSDSRAYQFDDREYDIQPSVTYHYPSINKSTPFRYDSSSTARETPRTLPPRPPRPPKERYDDRDEHRDEPAARRPPPLPSKEPISSSTLTELSSLEPDLPPPLPPKTATNSKNKRITFRPAAYLENGTPIRPVFIPSLLRKSFLDIAADNTRKGLEMCGILCGTPVNNALFITCLLIPEQKCTSDTCETENESAMLEYCITNDLLIIGWIHTHPTQTCFMSSRDLHTQAGYQVMMPESIAIVCAPRFDPSYGIFRLTNPPGLPHILACKHSDTFHQHSIDNTYTDAGPPSGHVYENSNMEFEVHDLRPRKH